jgi:hypothetical protein
MTASGKFGSGLQHRLGQRPGLAVRAAAAQQFGDALHGPRFSGLELQRMAIGRLGLLRRPMASRLAPRAQCAPANSGISATTPSKVARASA